MQACTCRYPVKNNTMTDSEHSLVIIEISYEQ
jgi:hypothetical protein